MARLGVDHERGFVLPTGTVTFILTDVEGSSRRWEDAPEAMATAIARHYDLLEDAIAGHGGVRPVEQGEGDSVVGAFSRASDALAAAVDAQKAFSAEEWPPGAALRVRMAVHTGEAKLRDSGNYFGQAVVRCARLRAVGHGGQVLVSDPTAALVAGQLPDRVELLDLGLHRFKDLSRPERVWQLSAPGLPAGFPPLRSLDAFRHNLPVQVTPLIGRERLTAELIARLEEDRLITLTGSGGVGKTRLALAVAGEALDRFPGGVWLVELAGVAHPKAVAAAALAALGVQQAPGADLTDQIVALLGGEPSLLVLDNCEHLIGGCADFVATLLAASLTISVLTTSREPLSVSGEVTWRVPSLDAPPAEPALAVATVSQYDAVRLFIDRARRARPSFTVSDTNAPAVAQICHRLDGIPLAIELAAARCRQLSAERIAHDLDDRFRLLTGGARTVLPRHQTLAASIDWSHDRLDPLEAVTFRRLGAFAGPFPLEAAEAIVASLGDVDPVGVFDTLSRLVDKSLVVVDDTAEGEPRYRLIETLRVYAANRAEAAGELSQLVRQHATWWLSWLQARWPVAHTDGVVDEVELFYGSIKAALDWTLTEPAIGLPLLRTLGRPTVSTGRASDLLDAVDHLLTEENSVLFPYEWTHAANAVAQSVITARGYKAILPLVQISERVAGEIGDEQALILSRWFQSYSPELATTLAETARREGDPYLEAMATMMLANSKVLADPQAANTELDSPEFHTVSRESRYVADFAKRVRALGLFGTGDLLGCMKICGELSTSRSTMIAANGIYTLTRAALLAADETQLGYAVEVANRRLRTMPGTAVTADLAANRLELFRGRPPKLDPQLRPDDPGLGPIDLYISGREAIAAGASELAVDTARTRAKPTPFSQAVLAAIEAAATQNEQRWHDALITATDHGLRLLVVDALEGLAVAASGAESWAECFRLWSAAQRLRAECNYQWRFPHEQKAIDNALDAARDQLDVDAIAAAETEGRGLAWPDAARYARRARGERKRPLHGWASLTPTENQVVELVAEGLTNPEIAQRLIMGRATVKTHLEHIFAKLGISSRTELAAQATRRLAP